MTQSDLEPGETMRFQKGVRFPYYRRPRGPGRRGKPGGCYRMSRAAYQARISTASKARAALARRQGKPERTYEETRRLEFEIALASHRGETYRAMASRLGCSHIHCWNVARRYRTGQIPMLPPDEQELVALRDSLDREPSLQQAIPWWMARDWRSHDEIWGCTLLTQEQKVQAAAELDRREYAKQHPPESHASQQAQPMPGQSARRLYKCVQQPAASDEARVEIQRSNPYRVLAHAKTLREWQELERRGGRRVLFSVSVR